MNHGGNVPWKLKTRGGTEGYQVWDSSSNQQGEYNRSNQDTGNFKSIIGKCYSETTLDTGIEEHTGTLVYFAYDQE